MTRKETPLNTSADIQRGDIVRFRHFNNMPDMFVAHVNMNQVMCVWFAKDWNFYERHFSMGDLVRISKRQDNASQDNPTDEIGMKQ